MFPILNGKKSYHQKFTQFPEKPIQKDLELENITSLMSWENIIASFVEITCSALILNFLQLADGQVFSKQTKKESVINEIPLTEWKERKFFVKDVILI